MLASGSERRQELLNRITSDFQTVVSNFDEGSVVFNEDAKAYVMELSKGKAQAVAEQINMDAIIIGADTIVMLDNKVLGKPKSEFEAFQMLMSLSDKCHEVYSGITIIDTKNQKIISDVVCTKVKFSNISKEDIQKYIETGEPMDKAGAYGIQGYGGVFVESIDGCYYNVVGLPLNKLSQMLKQFVY